MQLLLDASLPDIRMVLARNGEAVRTVVERDGKGEVIEAVMNRILNETGCSIGEIDEVWVTRGPGSFTGLRVALAFAQGLTFAPPRGKGKRALLRQGTTFELLAAEASRRGMSGEGTLLFPARKGWSFAARMVAVSGELPRTVRQEMVADADLSPFFESIRGWSMTPAEDRYLPFAPAAVWQRDEVLLDAVLPIASLFPEADPVRGIAPNYIEKPHARPIRTAEVPE